MLGNAHELERAFTSGDCMSMRKDSERERERESVCVCVKKDLSRT